MSQSIIIAALQKQLAAKDAIIAEKDAAYNLLLEEKKSLQNRIDSLTFELSRVYKVINTGKSETFKNIDNHNVAQPGNLFDADTAEQMELDGDKVHKQKEAELANLISKQKSSKPAINREKKVQKPTGPKGFPEYIPRHVTVLQPEGNVTGGVCLGYDKKETLHFTPAKFWIEQELRYKYLIKDVEKDQTVFVQVPAPNSPLDRLTAAPSLLSTLLVDKFVYHLPIHRQIKKFEQYGYAIPAATINGWLDKTQQLLEPLYDALRSEVLNTNSLQADETPIGVMGLEKGKLHQGYLWLYRNIKTRMVLFDFQLSRAAKHPIAMLKDYEGHLQVDGYVAYETVETGSNERIKLSFCHAHARRKFVESFAFDQIRSEYYITEIGKVYKVEQDIKDKNLTGQDKVAYRETYAGPILADLKNWLQKQQSEVVPGTPTAKAIDYALKRWDGLTTYLHYDFLEPDTNLLEQKVRPNTLGRRNWLFAGSKHGGKRIAMMYSLTACCKEYKIDPNEYFEDVIKRIGLGLTKICDIKELLPNNWKPAATTVIPAVGSVALS